MAVWQDITDRLATPIYVQRDGACSDGFVPTVRWKGTTETSPDGSLALSGGRWVMPGDGAVPETCDDAPVCGGPEYGYYVPVGLRLDTPIAGVMGLRIKVQLQAEQLGFSAGSEPHYLISRDFAALNPGWVYDNTYIHQDPVGNHVGGPPGYGFPEETVASASLVTALADTSAAQTLQVIYSDLGAGPFTLHSVSSLLLSDPFSDECNTTRYGVYNGRPMFWVPLIQVWVLTDGPAGNFWTDFVKCSEVTV